MIYRTAFVGLLLVAISFVAMPASADPRVVAGPCVDNLIHPGYTECYGVTNGCNDGLVTAGVGHSFSSSSDGGGWCYVSVQVFSSSHVAALCEDIDEGGGPTCVGR